MADNFDTCLDFTLKAEGGYSNNPADSGGPTNMGITLATYRQWSDNPNLGALQIQDMSERTASAIYRSLYWNPLRADALPTGVDLSVFDTDRRIEGAQRLQSISWDEARRTRAIIGTPELVADRLAGLRDQLGLAGILAELNTGGLIPHEKVMRSMQLLCEKVQPRLY